MSTFTLEPAEVEYPADGLVDERRPASSLGAVAILTPLAATAIALLLHRYIPNQQTSAPTALYPLIVGTTLLISVGIGVVSLFWGRARPWISYHAPLLAGAVSLVCLWDLLTLKWAWLPLPFFPGPDMVLQALVDDRAILSISTYHSLRLLLVGYSAGVVAGLFTGLLVGWFRMLHYWGMPILKIAGPIPATAFIPLAMVIFANSFLSGASLIALAAWFPVTILTSSGIMNVPVSYLDVAQTLGGGRRYLLFRVALPAAMPTIFVGFFMGLASAFLTLMAAETVGAKDGLGWYVTWQTGWADYARVYAAIVIMAVCFSSIMTVLFKARDRVLLWQKGLIRW